MHDFTIYTKGLHKKNIKNSLLCRVILFLLNFYFKIFIFHVYFEKKYLFLYIFYIHIHVKRGHESDKWGGGVWRYLDIQNFFYF